MDAVDSGVRFKPGAKEWGLVKGRAWGIGEGTVRESTPQKNPFFKEGGKVKVA